MLSLKERLDELDSMDVKQRHKDLIISFLAGNIFDWGAKEIARMLETNTFGFNEAKAKVPGMILKLNFKRVGNGNFLSRFLGGR